MIPPIIRPLSSGPALHRPVRSSSVMVNYGVTNPNHVHSVNVLSTSAMVGVLQSATQAPATEPSLPHHGKWMAKKMKEAREKQKRRNIRNTIIDVMAVAGVTWIVLAWKLYVFQNGG